MRLLFRSSLVCLFVALASGCGTETLAHLDPVDAASSHALRATQSLTGGVSHVIVLGDSISSGVGAASPELSYASLAVQNEDAVYPFEIGRDLRSYFGRDLRYVNVAHPGDTTDEVRYFQIPALLRPPSQGGLGEGVVRGHVIVLMTAGGNDLQGSFRPNSTFTGAVLKRSLDNLDAIVDFFQDKQRFPDGTSLFFGNIYDITDGEDQAHACLDGLAFPGLSTALVSWSDAYRQLAIRRQSTLIDLLSSFRGHGFNYANPYNPYFDPRDPTLWVFDRDCVHPNNRGHHMLRRLFMRQIADRFGLAQGPSRN